MIVRATQSLFGRGLARELNGAASVGAGRVSIGGTKNQVPYSRTRAPAYGVSGSRSRSLAMRWRASNDCEQRPLELYAADLDTFSGARRLWLVRALELRSARISAPICGFVQRCDRAFQGRLLIAAYVEGEEQAQIFDRERAIIYLYIGNALAFQEDRDGALREYLEAVQTDPQLAEAHYNLGVSFAARPAGSRIAAFKEALEHTPSFTRRISRLGAVISGSTMPGGLIFTMIRHVTPARRPPSRATTWA